MTDSLGISASYSDPLWRLDRNKYLNRFNPIMDDLELDWNAFGGYASAKISLGANIEVIEEWIDDGLGRHIEVYDHAGVMIWEGFVNSIKANTGTLTMSIGPLLKINNRVLGTYTRILDDTVVPAILGSSTETLIAEDLDSQNKYGILEGVVSIGTVLEDFANDIRDTFLNDTKDPYVDKNLNLSRGDIRITIECVGYYKFFEKYIYNDNDELFTTVSDKLEQIILADPNGIFSTSFQKIETNNLLDVEQETKNAMAMGVIKKIVNAGDVNGNRFLFGVYENRVVKYNSIPNEIEYKSTIDESIIRNNVGSEILPWNIEPGKWIFFDDLLIGREPPPSLDELRKDPRALFIEQVSYRSPYDLRINGVRLNTNFKQKIAQLGLAKLE